MIFFSNIATALSTENIQSYFDNQLRIETAILINFVIPAVAFWITDNPCTIFNVIQAVMRVAMYP